MATFHHKHGNNVYINEDRTLATGGAWLVPGYYVVFSADPVKMGEITNLKVEDKGKKGSMCIGLTAQDPVRYKRGGIYDIPRTWCIYTDGDMYQDGWGTEGVCPRWQVSTGDTVSIQWDQPTVTVNKNTDVIHAWDIQCTGKLWMVAALDLHMKLRISGPEQTIQPQLMSLDTLQLSPAQTQSEIQWQQAFRAKLDAETPKKEEVYPMTSLFRGLAIIVNNYRIAGHAELKGAKVDQVNMEQLWKDLGFRTEIKENIPATKFQDYLEEVRDREELKNISCFVLVLMSHGDRGYIRGADGGKVDLIPIFWKFSNDGCKNLIGKPKLIFIEACRGRGIDTARADPDPRERFPAYSDTLVAYSSSPGYVSTVDEVTGSYFTQSVCKVFREQHHRLDVSRMINRVVAHVHSIDKVNNQIQGPVWESTFRKDLWL